MKWTDAGLMLLILSGIAGLVAVSASPDLILPEEGSETEEPASPMELLEREFAAVCYGETFKTVAMSGDTLRRSMDLLREVPADQANLHITRALSELGFGHHATLSDEALGLSFLCSTPDGRAVRLDLISSDR